MIDNIGCTGVSFRASPAKQVLYDQTENFAAAASADEGASVPKIGSGGQEFELDAAFYCG